MGFSTMLEVGALTSSMASVDSTYPINTLSKRDEDNDIHGSGLLASHLSLH